jgi:hypothetical protein
MNKQHLDDVAYSPVVTRDLRWKTGECRSVIVIAAQLIKKHRVDHAYSDVATCTELQMDAILSSVRGWK